MLLHYFLLHLLRPEVGRRVDKQRLVPDNLLDLLSRPLAIPEALFREGNLPIRYVHVRLSKCKQVQSSDFHGNLIGTCVHVIQGQELTSEGHAHKPREEGALG